MVASASEATGYRLADGLSLAALIPRSSPHCGEH